MADQRSDLVQKMIAEGTSDEDILATLKVYDSQHKAAPSVSQRIGTDLREVGGGLMNFGKGVVSEAADRVRALADPVKLGAKALGYDLGPTVGEEMWHAGKELEKHGGYLKAAKESVSGTQDMPWDQRVSRFVGNVLPLLALKKVAGIGKAPAPVEVGAEIPKSLATQSGTGMQPGAPMGPGAGPIEMSVPAKPPLAPPQTSSALRSGSSLTPQPITSIPWGQKLSVPVAEKPIAATPPKTTKPVSRVSPVLDDEGVMSGVTQGGVSVESVPPQGMTKGAKTISLSEMVEKYGLEETAKRAQMTVEEVAAATGKPLPTNGERLGPREMQDELNKVKLSEQMNREVPAGSEALESPAPPPQPFRPSQLREPGRLTEPIVGGRRATDPPSLGGGEGPAKPLNPQAQKAKDLAGKPTVSFADQARAGKVPQGMTPAEAQMELAPQARTGLRALQGAYAATKERAQGSGTPGSAKLATEVGKLSATASRAMGLTKQAPSIVPGAEGTFQEMLARMGKDLPEDHTLYGGFPLPGKAWMKANPGKTGAAIGGGLGLAYGANKEGEDPLGTAMLGAGAGAFAGKFGPRQIYIDSLLGGGAIPKNLAATLQPIIAEVENIGASSKLTASPIKEMLRLPTNARNFIEGLKNPQLQQANMSSGERVRLPFGRTIGAIDNVLKEVLKRSGMTSDEWERYLLTSNNPATVAFGTQGPIHNPLARVLFPFLRIPVNVVRHGIQETAHMLGMNVTEPAMPHVNPWMRRGLTAGSIGAGYLVGDWVKNGKTPEERKKRAIIATIMSAALGPRALPFAASATSLGGAPANTAIGSMSPIPELAFHPETAAKWPGTSAYNFWSRMLGKEPVK